MANVESFFGVTGNHTGRTFDKLLEFTPQDTALTAAAISPVIYIGTGLIDADLVVDVSAGTVTVAMQFSENEAFTTPVAGANIALAVGRSIVPFRNLKAPATGPYGYMRLSYDTTGATLGAFIGKK